MISTQNNKQIKNEKGEERRVKVQPKTSPLHAFKNDIVKLYNEDEELTLFTGFKRFKELHGDQIKPSFNQWRYFLRTYLSV